MKKNQKDILGFIMIVFSSIFLFIVSNFYLLNKGYNIKVPIIITIIVTILLNIFPSLLTKDLCINYLKRIRNGYRLLIMFFMNVVFDIIFYLFSYFKYKNF